MPPLRAARYKRRIRRTQLGVALAFSFGAAACGGISGNGAASGTGGGSAANSSGGVASSAGQSATAGRAGEGAAASCVSPSAPTIAFTPACAGFVPAIAPAQVTFVERAPIDPVTRLVAHHFRSPPNAFDCGFDVVLSLPALTFSADSDPYQLSTWWVQGGGLPTGIVAAILRRPDAPRVLLALGTAGSLDLMNLLASPLSLAFNDASCGDSAATGLLRAGLERDENPLPCRADASSGTRLCTDSDGEFRVVGYVGAASSSDVPGLFGDAALLRVVD